MIMARLMIALCRLEQDACKQVTLAIKDNLFELDFDSKGNCFIDIKHEDVIRVTVEGEGLVGQNESGDLEKSILAGVSIDHLPSDPDQVVELVDDSELTSGQKTMQDVPVEIAESLIKNAEIEGSNEHD